MRFAIINTKQNLYTWGIDMAQEIEIEFKNLLTKAEYNRLLDALPFPTVGKTQTNHYFETVDFQLKQKVAALRIREINGVYQLTLKEPYDDGLLETHDQLTSIEASNWFTGKPVAKPHTSHQLDQLGIQIQDLQYWGSLQTERKEFKQDGYIYVLDYSTYHGHYDYELELEVPQKEAGEAHFNELLKQHHIIKRHTPNKIQRFFTSKK